MRVFQRMKAAEAIALTQADRPGQSGTVTIKSHDQSTLETAGEKRTGGVRAVVVIALELVR